MIALSASARVYLACGVTDMRKGMVGLAMMVQQTLAEDPFGGAIFAFRGRRAGLIKLIWHDGVGLCMLTKRLEQGHLRGRPPTTGRITLSSSQLVALFDGSNGGLRWRAAGRSSPDKIGVNRGKTLDRRDAIMHHCVCRPTRRPAGPTLRSCSRCCATWLFRRISGATGVAGRRSGARG